MKNFLTEEERSKILDLRKSNLSIYKISREIHRNRKTVSAFINNPEEYVKEMEAYLAMPMEERKQSIKPRNLNSKAINPASLRKFLSEAEREKIDTYRSEGKSITSIAQLLGRGTVSIRAYTNNPEGYEEFINNSLTETVKKKIPNFLAKNSRLKILKLKESGLSSSKIAKRLRTSHESVLAFLKNQDDGKYEKYITSIKNTPQKDETNYDFESKMNGASRTTVKRYLTEEERSKIQEMREQNTSLKVISRLMHRSLDTINAFLKNPQQYEKEVQAYKEFRLSRSGKSNKSYKKLNDSLSEEDLKNYNKVSVEHRSVIKFLVKKGSTTKSIYEDLKKVYGKSAPDMISITYWAQQFLQGRQTVVNEAKSKQSDVLERPNGILSSTIIANGNSSGSPSSGNSSKKPPVKLKLFQFKLKPSKKVTES
ncbi:uncharacterized protein LOC129607716 [Condylostylus longicornis]|uniref:uncharacterized protein LOC129607716 n=1 Tax=Condylostylus longicornis TaxID=2530218 RepID=UPI00244DBA28|nr:uncharacterized protein LOC129607716 [Condylostylus longicornis]